MGGLVRAGRQAMVLAGTVALAGAGVVVVVSAPAAATTFSVTTSNNSGAGSLRQAFIDASADVTGARTIDVQAGLGPIT